MNVCNMIRLLLSGNADTGISVPNRKYHKSIRLGVCRSRFPLALRRLSFRCLPGSSFNPFILWERTFPHCYVHLLNTYEHKTTRSVVLPLHAETAPDQTLCTRTTHVPRHDRR